MYEYAATITSAYDGDTIHAQVDLGFGVWQMGTESAGLGDRYRLVRINAPELHAAGGAESLAYLLSLLGHLPASFTVRTVKDERDDYGRFLVDIILPSGESVSDLMLAAGQAVPWP